MNTLGDRFWEIMDGTVNRDPDVQLDALATALGTLDRDALLAFHADFWRASVAAYRWDLWGAAYVINGGCSDDGFIDFRSWLIAQGRAVYMAALADPESLADHIQEAFAEFEELAYVPIEVFEARFDAEFPDGNGPAMPADPAGTPWDEETVDALFPKIAAKVAELEA